MEIKIFKFGGASVNHAEGVRNVGRILKLYDGQPMVVILSAMGKTTNALEQVLQHFMEKDPVALVESYEKVRDYHFQIMAELFPGPVHPVYGAVTSLFDQLRGYIRRGHLYLKSSPGYSFEYDQIVGYGELISTAIVHHYLMDAGIPSKLFDVRELIRTDSTYQDAKVDWNVSERAIVKTIQGYLQRKEGTGCVALTQGFLGSDRAGNTTTLGREGSDFTAAVFAYALKSREVTIWKDVPGVMNADPKWKKDAVTLPSLSYREAIELAYYGASVIHPKTIKPLENAGITLKVKSFVNPQSEGTTIEDLSAWTIRTPIIIRKLNQVLISLSPHDFSFIAEENLSEIFRLLTEYRVRVNVMQNSAISFSFCVDQDPWKLPPLLERLREHYTTRYNEGVDLCTIRHYDEETIREITSGRKVLLEQKSRNTLQVVMM